jgi:hypothetical protein
VATSEAAAAEDPRLPAMARGRPQRGGAATPGYRCIKREFSVLLIFYACACPWQASVLTNLKPDTTALVSLGVVDTICISLSLVSYTIHYQPRFNFTVSHDSALKSVAPSDFTEGLFSADRCTTAPVLRPAEPLYLEGPL